MNATPQLMCENEEFVSMFKSLGEILEPTRCGESYPRIAIQVNEWLRKQIESGRDLETKTASDEQIRRIFCNKITRPAAIYLEALAEVQNVPLVDLLEAAGYPTARVIPVSDISQPMQVLKALRNAYEAGDPPTREAMKRELLEFIHETDEEIENNKT